jgi:hypothetical protein
MARIEKPAKAPIRATAAVGGGLLILTVSLLFVPKNLRDVGILLNRGDFVRDEFEVDYFSQGRRSNTFGGHVVSTGETLSTRDEGVIISGGLERRRELVAQRRLLGRRFPVWYLPAGGGWRFLDMISQFRVISPDVFEESVQSRVVWLGVGAGFWLAGALLLRAGVVIARSAASPDAGGPQTRVARRRTHSLRGPTRRKSP